ncbi:FimV/HubP family polar landmark protein, partial [Xanthomonas campestris]
ASPAPAAAAAAGAAGGARLEIAPAVATDTNKAGTTSGTSGEGEGEMAANEQLQQAKEDIATRDAELQELRTRVADLEKLKQQQQALIAMKDTDLAAAQRRLAETPAAPAQGGFPLWLIGGLVLIVAAVVAWLAARRRKPSPLPPLPRRNFDFIPPGAAAAAAEPDADAAATAPSERDVVQETEFEQIDLHEDERAGGTQPPLSDVLRREPQLAEPVPHATAPVVSSDDWRALRATPAAPSNDLADARPAPAAEPAPESAPAPMTAAHAPPSPATQQDSLDFDPAPPVPVADAPHAETFSAAAPREFASAGRDRLELAVAYMDLGDKDTARGLLLEVAATGDAATRAEAADLLDRLA